jgi:hypothetical protein
MSWLKIDDQFPNHPKVVKAGPLAGWLFVCGLAYCGQYLTDGFIPMEQICRLADVANTQELVKKLCHVGLWDKVDDGYQIVGWQPNWVVADPGTQDLRHTREYEKFKLAVLERDDYTCVGCGDNSIEVHVHHIRPFATYPPGRTDPNNAKTLCVACHEAAHERRLR